MSFKISSWSIHKPVPTLVVFLILAIVGMFSFTQLGIDENPNIDFPLVSVTIVQPGAGPTELETEVTKKVEDAIASIEGVDELRSTVTDGQSSTTIMFELETNSDTATNDVRNAIAQIRQTLPQDIEDPIVQKIDFMGQSVIGYAVTSPERSVAELSDLVDRDITRDLLSVPGVARVDRIGGVDEEIRIDLNPTRLQALGITASEVNQQIRDFNINLPGGRSQTGGTEKSIRTLGSAATLETLKTYRIVLPNGEDIPLTSLGEVNNGFAEPRQVSRLTIKDNPDVQQTPVVGFSVWRSSGSTLVSVEEGVQKKVAQLQETLPEDIQLELIFTNADYIRLSYQASIDALVVGSLLTVVTVGIFLRDWRGTLITAFALPLSIIPTFIVLRSLGYTLNDMTLLGFALAMGNLVDDAICMIENISQHIQMGKRPFQAALDAANEIGLAVLATTATIVAVFVPVAFMGGIPGEFFRPFGITVSVATLFSTLVATTMTPMLAAYLLKGKKVEETSLLKEQNPDTPSYHLNSELTHRGFRWGQRTFHPYRRLLGWALSHRIVTLMIAVAFFVGSMQLIPLIPTGLFGGYDRGLTRVTIKLPPGSPLSLTDQVMQTTTEMLQDHPAFRSALASAGEGDSGINEALITVNLLPPEVRGMSQKEFEQQMRQKLVEIPGARVTFQAAGAAGNATDISVVLSSETPELLKSTADELESFMRGISGLVEVTSSASLVKPELLITPDPERAADLGVSVEAIARTASLATIGDNDANLAKFNLPDRQIPIRIQIGTEERNDIETLRNLRVPSQNGGVVPLMAVADIHIGSGPSQIDRFDRLRQVSLTGNLQGISLGQAMEPINEWLETNLPPEVQQQPSGDVEIMIDIFSRFATALGLGILGIYAILVLLYNNFLYPITIMVALPLSVGGALLALMITQKELAFYALIGIVLLMGLVTKNAILLVDCALANMREQGISLKPALIASGISRLRPIFMTTFSTIAGMTPIALGLGAGAQMRSPMAISVIGGMTTATLLTLVVVPTLFTYVHGFSRWLLRLVQGKPSQRPRLALSSEVKKSQFN
ncbi:MAG: efflux RND transporter permease subunit [Roseofilum sp. SBFL]|uniref:efflux RND transporter permease subunit n=1 Tax=unclassified Roseofilum TaxID=2620099 RepID=UPI001B0E8A52|nr:MULTISPECIES: efflux RND transporter permease subunit [unclassified Roseofilum]MBP0012123.1 efflux RND transporter permease subunit [Roseofilum sp. SID3]MBP0023927.1 efflux RND transporter permease subunit [Roseofilum sp. SID2]MBP0039549.1 efflux RND transporter permease subunit [Roseofilum sp. SID1]MBP0044457.1 efflux RND transporter permease subunit [Roseofilum sp. SBFL]